MTILNARGILPAIAVFALAGCRGVGDDPCHVVLRDPGGPPEISRLRAEARAATHPLPYLERLGWSFIAREAIDHDHAHFDEALAAAACMEQRAPGDVDARLLRAHALVSMHRFKEGEAVARTLAGESSSWLASAVLGDALLEQGLVEEAAVHYQRMADGNPGSQALSRAAHLRWLLGDRDGAIEAMAGAAAAGDPRDARAGAWYRARLAHYLLEAGRPGEARRLIDGALALVSGHAPSLHARGLLLLFEGRPQEAVEPLRAAVAADPLPEYLWALQEALNESGRADEARAVEARLVGEGEREDRRGVALYLASRGVDPARALRLARAELDVRQDVVTLDTVAFALLADGRIDEARDYSRRALLLGTRAPRLALHAAAIAAAAGDATEAASRAGEAAAMAGALLPSERRLLERLGAARATTTTAGRPPASRTS
ncbi:MAG TPA: tetratricopeptide repeat protein [Candidatus Polarisedimenticolia bacterium]|nr:tetratricopeptide repeat protein [Candidatus Polarisedimenticolia bacterium]